MPIYSKIGRYQRVSSDIRYDSDTVTIKAAIHEVSQHHITVFLNAPRGAIVENQPVSVTILVSLWHLDHVAGFHFYPASHPPTRVELPRYGVIFTLLNS